MNSNRVVVVTGGASGMGLGICKRFAETGHQVEMLAQHIPIARAGTPENFAFACEFL